MGTATAAAVGKPLSPAEQIKLIELLTRAGGVSMVAAKMTARQKVGSKWQAVVNLSVPRPDGQTDLVMRGNTVTLTEDEAELFLPPHKAFPMIRPVAEQHQQLPFLHPRLHWGAARGIPGPMSQGGPPEQGGARVDPPGSTKVMVQIPEANEPMAGSEQHAPPGLAESLGLHQEGGPSFAGPDALDIPPGGGA